MKRILYAIALISLSACGNNEKQQSVSGTANSLPVQSSLLNNPEHGQAGHDCSLAVGAPLKQKISVPQPTAPANAINPPSQTITANKPTVPAAQVATTQKLNPAHGQPGHDCAIAVGAPLQQNISTPQQAPANTAPEIQSSIPAKTSDGQKINPAHGQPGHDCAVAVGAPLK